MNTLSDITIYSKYARYDAELNRKESWEEVVNRTEAMHIKRFHSRFINDIHNAFQYVLEKKVVPSLRSLQFSGRPIEGILNKELGQEQRMYNCGFIPIDSVDSVGEVMYCLLMGIGLGVSVRRKDIQQLPIININIRKPTIIYKIEDTCEGWADAIKFVFKSSSLVAFDYSLIRPAGSPLIKVQSIAPGPLKLKECLEFINEMLFSNNGKQLEPITIHKILCKIAECVVSASVRRSALLSIFDKDDQEMIKCKTGKWWDANPHLAMANNSVSLLRDEVEEEEFKQLMSLVLSQNAEPGILWTNDTSYGVNACSEISLKPYTFCNLTSIRLSDCETNEELFKRAHAAALIGTLQATYTNFTYLRPIWKKNTEEDYLIGVSLNGCAVSNLKDFNLKGAVSIIRKVNDEWAKKLKIKPSKRLTTIKPEGTNALVSMCSSGCHPYHSRYYLRRMRFSVTEPIFEYLNKIVPELLEKEKRSVSDDLYVLTLAISIPENGLTRDDESVLDFLERVKYLNENWIQPGHINGPNNNNVSATVSIKPEEHEDVIEWMWNNRNYYNGLSVLEYNGHTFEQAPFETCSKEEYEKINIIQSKINMKEIKENPKYIGKFLDVGCDSESCSLK